MKIKEDLQYMEGRNRVRSMIKFIHNTEYGSIETAIEVKQNLVDQFENQFGYSREMDVEAFDSNYAFNLGMLDALKEYQENQ